MNSEKKLYLLIIYLLLALIILIIRSSSGRLFFIFLKDFPGLFSLLILDWPRLLNQKKALI